MMQGMFTLSGAPSTTSHWDILHQSISLFGKSSSLMHLNFGPHEELLYQWDIHDNFILFYFFHCWLQTDVTVMHKFITRAQIDTEALPFGQLKREALEAAKGRLQKLM